MPVMSSQLSVLIEPQAAEQVADDEVYLVLNAGCKEKDVAHISQHLKWYKVGSRSTALDPSHHALLMTCGCRAKEATWTSRCTMIGTCWRSRGPRLLRCASSLSVTRLTQAGMHADPSASRA